MIALLSDTLDLVCRSDSVSQAVAVSRAVVGSQAVVVSLLSWAILLMAC